MKQAIAWIREHIAEYGGDPDYIAITGGSAGGHLAALTALTPNDPDVAARLRGRRHLGAARRPALRRLRLGRLAPAAQRASRCATCSSRRG